MDGIASVCPVCNSRQLARTVERSRLPAMQNYVFRTATLAHDAKMGQLCLLICRQCGFAFNGAFDPSQLDYDQGYDNSVPSSIMASYYEDLARYLNAEYLHDEGLIVDVGCGKGTFLKTLSRLFPRVRGLGIDPSYEGPRQGSGEPLQFICEFFAAAQLTERPDLVICRHVLEHIHQPVAFLESLRLASLAFPGVPFFIEVPDLRWIVKHQAFWDFCYEHCNYFTPPSLSNTMALSGFRPTRSCPAFGGQYIWLEARTEAEAVTPSCLSGNGQELIGCVEDYLRSESDFIKQTHAKLTTLKREGWRIALWGMATKGILFTCLIDPQRSLFDFCIDINDNKQNCYVPTTGHRIESPDVLTPDTSRRLVVVVMNPNYLSEIKADCLNRGLAPTFLDATGNPLPQ